jgi:hypothetical protein
MGLFSQPPPVDSDLAKLLIAEDPKCRRDAEKAVAKSQHGTATWLEDGEEIRAIAQKEPFSNEILVVTDRRLMRVKKGARQFDPISLEDIAKVETLAFGRSAVQYAVNIMTRTSTLYAIGDARRYNPTQYVGLVFNDPRDAHALCSIVETLAKRTQA